MNEQEQLAVSNCDKEPVHIPGRIQPFGAMLGFDLATGIVLHHSDNLLKSVFHNDAAGIGISFEKLIGQRQIVHAIRGALGLPTIRTQRVRVGTFEIKDVLHDVAVYVVGEVAVVEFESNPVSLKQRPQSPVSMVRAMLATISQEKGMEELLQSSVSALRQLTGHDRVMAYRFLENGDGEVVAESKGPGIEPYLGLRYPASDIPSQVRQIMIRSPFRIIHDIHAKHAALVSAAEVKPLDMTLSHLRGVSPIHVEYLENMGVRSTMNIAIIVRGQLWGLFAFHHYRPRMISPDQRSICELFGSLSSMKIQQVEERERLDQRQHLRAIISAISEESRSPDESVSTQGAEIMSLMDCDGVGYLTKKEFFINGAAPSFDIMKRLAALSDGDTVVLDNLLSTGAFSKTELGTTAGAMLLKIDSESHLVFLRNEVAFHIRWAGGKEKTITQGPNGPRLTPRGSFDEYKESVTGRCNPWTPEEVESAAEIRREVIKSMFSSSNEISKHWERQKKYQDLLIAELNHRVRNTLAMVHSIAKQTAETSHSLEHYVESLEQRIGALSVAHDLVGGSGLQGARIDELVRRELAPFDIGNAEISYSGPHYAVRPDVAAIVSLLLHEMASNAVKHGALSPKGSALFVRWFEDDGGLACQWVETLHERLAEPERRGFGLALIERALAYECNGRSKIEFNEDKIEINLWLPSDVVTPLADADLVLPSVSQEVVIDEKPFSNLQSVLVIEDNLILGMELEKLLRELGVQEVFAMGTLTAAHEVLEKHSFDCAVLDINLGDENTLKLAKMLQDQGVPLVFATGYDNESELAPELQPIPRLIKPVSRPNLTFALSEALNS